MTSGSGAQGELGSGDTWIQKALRRWGVLVATHPFKTAGLASLFCLVITLAGWLPRFIDHSAILIDRRPQSLQWTVGGGKLEAKLRTFLTEHGEVHPWQKPVSVTMFAGKGNHLDKDIITREAFEEYYEVMQAYSQLKVTVQGEAGPLTYTIFDLCDRGILPDIPGQELFMPCVDIGPMHCFAEQLTLMHPSYQALDPFMTSIPALSAALPMPYASRPSFRNLTDAELKATMSYLYDPLEAGGSLANTRGCYFWTGLGRINVGSYNGLTTWENATITSMQGIRTTLFLDAVPRISYRMSLAKPGHTKEQDIRAALKALSTQWQNRVLELNEKTKILEVVNMEDFAYFVTPRMDEEQRRVNLKWQIAGVAGLLAFCFIATLNPKYPLSSRATLVSNGLGVIGQTTGTALGFYLLIGFDLNGVILLATPLLAFGVGADDMFVMVRYLSNCGFEFISTHTHAEVTGEVLAQAGPGIALSSMCNALSFGVGSFFPIFAMRRFCFSCLLVSLVDFALMMTLFTVMIREEARRIAEKRPEPSLCYTCHKRVLTTSTRADRWAANADEQTSTYEKRAIGFIRGGYAKCVTSVAGRCGTTLFGLLLTAVSIYFAAVKEYGYSPHELFENDDPMYRSIELTFSKFTAFPAFLVFDDVDMAKDQEDMVDLYMELIGMKYGSDGSLSPWLTVWYSMYYYEILFSQPPEAVVPTLQDLGFLNAASTVMNTSYKYGKYLPCGPYRPDDRVAFLQGLEKDRAIPPSSDAYSHPQQFSGLDLAGVNEFTFRNRSTAAGVAYQELTLNFFVLFLVDLENEGKFVDAIAEYHRIIDESPIKDKVFLNSPLVFWETFLDLETYLYILGAIAAVGLLIITLIIFSCDVVGAVITTVACSMIFIQIYGLSLMFMRFNIFVAAISLFGLGMSVEFTAHLAAAFSLNKEGTVEDRLGSAMAHSFPALVEGALSTLVTVAPMAFFPKMFVVKYFFIMLALVVVVGLLNGCVILPGMLALLSSLTDNKAKAAAVAGADAAQKESKKEPQEEAEEFIFI